MKNTEKTIDYTATVTSLPETSEVEIVGEIAEPSFTAYEPRVIRHLKEDISLPGFRKGHVPERMIKERMGDAEILGEMAEEALRDTYPRIVEEHKLDPIGRPEVSITKIARGNPLGFKIKVAVVPKFTLPDYKKIASGVKLEPVSVDEKELSEALLELRKRVSHMDRLAETRETGKVPSQEEPTDAELPPIDLAFAQKVAGVDTVEKLEEKVREGIKTEKELRAKSMYRGKIIESILAETKIPLPPVVVQGETEMILAELRGDIERMGMSFADYLTHVKKTEEEMRKDLLPDAQRRARGQLLLNAIADTEKISPDEESLKKEVARIKEAHPDADPNRVIMHVATQLVNEKVLEMLERGG